MPARLTEAERKKRAAERQRSKRFCNNVKVCTICLENIDAIDHTMYNGVAYHACCLSTYIQKHGSVVMGVK